MLIDIGANLTNKSFRNDLEQVTEDAIEVGVTNIIITGSTEQNSELAIELNEARPDYFYSTAGVHPHHANDYLNVTSKHLNLICENESVVAVGECGLDFNRNYSTKKEQLYCFEAQLDLGTSIDMPLFFHERDAHSDFLNLIKQYRANMKSGVVHCFTGQQNELEAYLDLDLHIGITGWICDERRGKHLKELVSLIPLNRLMIETNAPYLLPRTLDPRPESNRNEPKFLPKVCETISTCLHVDYDHVAEHTSNTAKSFFDI